MRRVSSTDDTPSEVMRIDGGKLTNMTRRTLLLRLLSLLLVVGVCLANCAAPTKVEDDGPEFVPDPWFLACSEASACGSFTSCIRPCVDCESLCRVPCNSPADCRAVGAQNCRHYELDGVQAGYCLEPPSPFLVFPAVTDSTPGQDGERCSLQAAPCDCPSDFCGDECESCCFDEGQFGVYEDGVCRPPPPSVSSAEATTATTGTTSTGGSGGAAGAGGSE